jgi:hypothetical protein
MALRKEKETQAQSIILLAPSRPSHTVTSIKNANDIMCKVNFYANLRYSYKLRDSFHIVSRSRMEPKNKKSSLIR